MATNCAGVGASNVECDPALAQAVVKGTESFGVMELNDETLRIHKECPLFGGSGQQVETLAANQGCQAQSWHRARKAFSVRSLAPESGLDPALRRRNGNPFAGEGNLESDTAADLGADLETCQDHDKLRQLETRLIRCTGQLEALNTIGRTLAATLDLREIYWAMFREIAQGLLGTPHLMVALFDQGNDTIHCGFAIIDGEEMDSSQFPPIPLGDGPVSDTIRSREPHIVDLRAVSAHLQATGRGLLRGSDKMPQSALYVPMVSGDKVVGVMHVQHYEADAFRETDLSLLSILASQAAVAVSNARLYANEQERADALAQALEKQQELDRLRTEIVQNVSHELRTPLAIVHGYTELLDRGELGELEPEQQEAVTVVARRVKTLLNMIEGFTTVMDAETEKVPPEPVHLAQVVQMLQDDFQVSAQRAGVTLGVEISPGVQPVFGFSGKLRQVVENLVTNALKFTPSGGKVTVRLWQQDANAILEVADTGIGIPSDKLELIFERFFQVDGSATRRHGGVGLGLALVKEIVEAHGGRVSVESAVGAGSTFHIQLPVA